MGVCLNCNRSNLQIVDNKVYEPGYDQRGEIKRTSTITNKVKCLNPVIDERSQGETFEEAPKAQITTRLKSDKDIALISSVLKTHYIFSNIDKASQLSIIKKVKCYEINGKEIIFQQGQPGVCFYVVSSGRLEVRANNERSILIAGMSFGELALLDDRPRTATITTLEPCILWSLDRKTFMKTITKIRMQEYDENKKFINSVGIFNILTNTQKEALLGACVTQTWPVGHVIIKEGDIGNLFYIVKEGTAVCNPEKSDSIQVHTGGYFGEHALLFERPRLATVVAATEIKLITIGKQSLLEVLGNDFEYILFRNSQRIALERSPALKSLSIKQREALLDHTVIKKYQSGDVVVRKGSVKCQKLWILIRGKILSNVFSVNIEPFQCIGDEDITNKGESVYEEDYLSVGESDVADISVEELEKCIGGEVSLVTIHNDAVGVLRQVQLLRGLSQERVNSLTLALKILNFEDKQVIVQQNNPGHSFFIIKTGTVRVYKNEKYLRNITKNDYFGERSVLFNDFRTATVIAEGPVSCWSLESEDFIHIISENIREKLIKRIDLQDSSVLFSDLLPVKTIGTGALGNVILAVNKETKSLYALKAISRQRIEKYNTQANLILEKKILMQLDHIMIIKLIKTFKDNIRIYFLMEFVQGKDLFDVLMELRQVSEEQAKFYAASLMMILEYLHERSIIHRDLKPENVMIDEEGYLKLIDFGAATVVEGRTYTAIGTPHYLAPEIILRTGYSFGADWWSLGILIHEMVYGFVPFGEEDEDPISIYEKILDHKLEFKGLAYKSNYFKGLLTQLLNKNPAARICGGFSNLKNNSWFGNFNWDRLISRQLRPPYSPKYIFNSEEIEVALQTQISIDDYLSELEISQTSMLYKKRTQAPAGEDWDENF